MPWFILPGKGAALAIGFFLTPGLALLFCVAYCDSCFDWPARMAAQTPLVAELARVDFRGLTSRDGSW
jgi:hypothetical protein